MVSAKTIFYHNYTGRVSVEVNSLVQGVECYQSVKLTELKEGRKGKVWRWNVKYSSWLKTCYVFAKTFKINRRNIRVEFRTFHFFKCNSHLMLNINCTSRVKILYRSSDYRSTTWEWHNEIKRKLKIFMRNRIWQRNYSSKKMHLLLQRTNVT